VYFSNKKKTIQFCLSFFIFTFQLNVHLSSAGQGESFLDLKVVFLPLLALEIITLVDNFR
jgi:hypothetical protein